MVHFMSYLSSQSISLPTSKEIILSLNKKKVSKAGIILVYFTPSCIFLWDVYVEKSYKCFTLPVGSQLLIILCEVSS